MGNNRRRFVPQDKFRCRRNRGAGRHLRTSALPAAAGAPFRCDGGEILGNVKIAVRGLHNPEAHIGVFRIEDVASVIVLEARLVHKGCFCVADGLVDGNVLRQSAPVNSGGVDSDEWAPALPVKMAEVAVPEHVSGMRPRHPGQFLVPPERSRPAARFPGVPGASAVAVDQCPHLLFEV